ncbi:MAG: choice-of-anchor J domain-containing protein [Bacteroidales bacterium]
MNRLKNIAGMLLAFLLVFTACNNVEDNIIPPGVQDPNEPVTLYFQDFNSVVDNGNISLEGWKIEKVKGDRDWQGKLFDDNGYAQASAHNGTAEEYEYWLISPGFNVKDAVQKTVSFKTSKSFWQNTSSLEVYAMVSNEVASEKRILDVTIAEEASADNTFILSGDIDLSNEGDLVYIGFRYQALGGASNSTTFRIDDFSFGGATGNEGPVGDGDGSKENPYTVSQAIAAQGQGGKWVEGYIVGAVNVDSENNENTWTFAPGSFVTNSNILIAQSLEETEPSKLIHVQLPNTEIRSILNLVNNEARAYHKKVAILGDLTAYFGKSGLRNSSEFVLEGYTPEEAVVEVCGDQSTVHPAYSFDFNNVVVNTDFAQEGWQNIAIQGSRKWQGKIFEENGYIQATAHGATANLIHESWVISPALDLTSASVKSVSFETAQAYWKDDTKFEVFVLQCIDGVTVQTKVEPTVLATSTTPNYEFVPGAVDLSAFTGTVFIGFRYEGMGGQSLSTTWCIDNFVFGEEPSTETKVSITSSAVTSVVTGGAYSYEVKTNVLNASGATTITATGLPEWASLTDNGDGTATIAGTAPEVEESSDIVITATNNGVSVDQSYTLTVKSAVIPGGNMVVNGDFKLWDANIPSSWVTNVSDAVFTKSTDAVIGDYVSITPSATTYFTQFVPVEGGKTYRLTWKYKSADKKFRVWSSFTSEASYSASSFTYLTGSADTDPLRSNNGYLAANTELTEATPIEFVAPAGFSFMRLEFRFYKDSEGSLADVELVEVN